jgi:uncharacterized protein YkwD
MPSTLRSTLTCALVLFALPMAQAATEPTLAQLINAYRAHPTGCPGATPSSLPPLTLNPTLALAPGYTGGLRDGLKAQGYQAATVRAIRLDGPLAAQAAFAQLRANYCTALLDSQYAELGISQAGTQWRLMLARPLLEARLNDPRAAAQALLAQVNAARAKPRLCGQQRFGAARPLTWSPALGAAAFTHSQSMAQSNYFSHVGPQGDTPYDRAKAAGYRGRQVGENMAAGQGSPTAAMAGWLASPGHCANLMNPLFTQVGAGYQALAASQNGIYWTMVFGAP